MRNPRVLLVDDNEAVRTTLQEGLELNNFDVVAASGVNDALAHIGADRKFDVLLSDLHMPGKGDGLTVVSAMRHANPLAVTLVLSGYPEMRAATDAILLQADEILMKPLGIPTLVKTIRQRLMGQSQASVRITADVAAIIEDDAAEIVAGWLARVNTHRELVQIPLTSEERTGHLPQLLKDVVIRLRQPQRDAVAMADSEPPREHGKLRHRQGYSASLMVEESRMLQVTIFTVLQDNLFRVDFSRVLLDVMTVADEVDRQLCEAVAAFSLDPRGAIAA